MKVDSLNDSLNGYLSDSLNLADIEKGIAKMMLPFCYFRDYFVIPVKTKYGGKGVVNAVLKLEKLEIQNLCDGTS